MITAVDTNILVDILEPDPVHGPPSKDALKRCLREGSVVACEVVLAEVATAYGHSPNELMEALNHIGIAYSAMTLDSALEAARRSYLFRRKKSGRERIAADFLIGGHALVQCDRLLTRDHGFYRRCFASLQVESPKALSDRES
jgi:predicted nucleic acid-binding protein